MLKHSLILKEDEMADNDHKDMPVKKTSSDLDLFREEITKAVRSSETKLVNEFRKAAKDPDYPRSDLKLENK